MDEQRPMLVVERNGRATVVTGWRAWLLAVAALLSGLVTLIFLALLFFGVAVAVGAVLLIVVPAAIIVAIVTALFSKRGQSGF
ncbi:hypothetical protein [Hyphomicrobium sp. NDB2Meth4]|uniref:hypothetical protein n=1 Tax=Hyphomicrobium sp. NDB2Meth4 TaxID=1892846 RepID=UPI000B1A8DD0|nr:hypothetical protein [Hyphomicrobium sp. NDB2Meth4]